MIRITRKRLIVSAIALLLLTGVLVATWRVCDWPPPRLILKYGFPPAGGPTGRQETIEGIDFVEISPGYFLMGSHHKCKEGGLLGRLAEAVGLTFVAQARHTSGECPTRWVEIEWGFWLAKCEVTVEQYARILRTSELLPDNDHPSDSDHLHKPMIGVSWNDAQEFCRALSKKSALPVRLPTEAEWEYACRGGTVTEFWSGDSSVEGAAHCGRVPFTAPQPVRRCLPNPWGLYDMHGNAAEWCEDAAHRSYVGAPSDGTARYDPGGWIEGSHEGSRVLERIVRGGAIGFACDRCRSASREGYPQNTRLWFAGFRLAISDH